MNSIIEKFGIDRITHAFVSGWLFFVFMIMFNEYDFAILSTVLVFTAKEFYDLYAKKDGFDVKDMIFNLLGLCVSLVYYDLQETHNIWNWLHKLI